MRYAMQSIASFGIFAVVLFATNTAWQSNCPPQLLYVATDESSTFLGEFKIGVAAHRVADRDSYKRTNNKIIIIFSLGSNAVRIF